MKYKNNKEYKLALHLLASLSYLPADDIPNAFDEIEDQFEDILGDFLDYFVHIERNIILKIF